MKNVVCIIFLMGALFLANSCVSNKESIKSHRIAESDQNTFHTVDYFPHQPGWNLIYDCISQINPADSGRRIITFQKPRADDELCFKETYYTDSKSGIGGNSIWVTSGTIFGCSNVRDNSYSDPMYRYICLLNFPSEFSNEQEFRAAEINYKVTTGTAYKEFADCIKISFTTPDDYGPPWEKGFLSGDGYFILARNVGMVYLYFKNRVKNDAEETFTLSGKPVQLVPKKVFGKVQDSQGNPLKEVFVSLDSGWLGLGWWGKTDGIGNFEFAHYWDQLGYTITVMYGYDENKDQKFDDNPGAWGTQRYSLTPEGNMDLGVLQYVSKP